MLLRLVSHTDDIEYGEVVPTMRYQQKLLYQLCCDVACGA